MEDRKVTTIMLVEDDPGHAFLIEKNLRRAGVKDPIIVLQNGREAVDYLAAECDRDDRQGPLPFIILLDLNMPVLDGFGVIKAVKSQSRTSSIPIVVVTTTDNPREVEQCYELGCNIYITKPVDYDQFADTMRRLGMFLSIVRIPGMKVQHG